jgi:hypothetical protein
LDRHEIWRRVQYDWKCANQRRAQGHVPVVLVWIAGRPEPIELGFVTTRRGPDEPWVRFETPGPPAETGAIPPGVSWVHVHESAVLAAEVVYRRASHGIGFTHTIESDEPDEPEELAA